MLSARRRNSVSVLSDVVNHSPSSTYLSGNNPGKFRLQSIDTTRDLSKIALTQEGGAHEKIFWNGNNVRLAA
jgi:hypothetical protein